MSLSESVDKLLPFARAVIAASMELEKYEPLEAALEERLAWLKAEVAKAEARRTAAVDEVAVQLELLAKAKAGVQSAEEQAKQIIANAERQVASMKSDAEREIANTKDVEARRRQRIHDDLDQRISKLTTKFDDLSREVSAKQDEHQTISAELLALKARFG